MARKQPSQSLEDYREIGFLLIFSQLALQHNSRKKLRRGYRISISLLNESVVEMQAAEVTKVTWTAEAMQFALIFREP